MKDSAVKQYVEARKKIERIALENNMTFYDIETIYLDKDHSYKFKDLDLLEALDYLENGYIIVPF